MTHPRDDDGSPRVIPFGADPPRPARRRRRLSRQSLIVGAAMGVVLFGYVATATPAPHLIWDSGSAPQERLNAESIIPTPTGFSVLGGPGPSGGIVWSTPDGENWSSRTLPRLSSRIVFHRRGLYVVDRRSVIRVGPDGDDPTALIDLPDSVRIGNGSQRSGLMAALDGLVAQTVQGDLFWSPDGRSFELAVEAAIWGADSDVPPSPADVLDVAPSRVRTRCRPKAKRAPDVPPIVTVSSRLVALIPEHDPSVVWPVCEPVLWESIDGSTWVPRSEESPFPAGAYVYDMAWRDGRYVAVGGIGFNDPTVWTSMDGETWERIEELIPVGLFDLTQVEAGGIGWVVIGEPRDGSDRIGWYSADGVCWESLPEGVAGRGVAVGDDRAMFVDGDPATVWVGTPSDSLSPIKRCL